MPDPTPYEPAYSFSGFQNTNPEAPLPAPALDNELFLIEQAIAAAIEALKDIRQSDGTLKHGSVVKASLSTGLLTGISAPSLWSTGAIYPKDATVFVGPKFYLALLDHTAGVFATDLADSKWILLADFTPTGAIAAGNVSFDPTLSGYTATTVQAAIDEAKAKADTDRAATIPLARLAADAQLGFIPIGMMAPFAGPAAPTGWFLCRGQNVSRTTYSALYDVIGNTWGAGDGSTTFTLPDLRGRVVAGTDTQGGAAANRLTGLAGGVAGTLGSVGGAQSHSLTAAQNAPHTHTGTTSSGGAHAHQFTHDVNGRTSGGTNTVNAIYTTSGSTTVETTTDGAHTHSFTTASQGSGSAHNNVQPTLVANWIIYAGMT